jgi:hypothetical protein
MKSQRTAYGNTRHHFCAAQPEMQTKHRVMRATRPPRTHLTNVAGERRGEAFLGVIRGFRLQPLPHHALRRWRVRPPNTLPRGTTPPAPSSSILFFYFLFSLHTLFALRRIYRPKRNCGIARSAAVHRIRHATKPQNQKTKRTEHSVQSIKPLSLWERRGEMYAPHSDTASV